MSASKTRKMLFLAVAAFVTVSAASAVAAEVESGDVLIRGAKVYTITSRGTFDSADVLVRGGRIAAVASGGENLQTPAGTKVVEAKGRPLTPGMFAGLTHIGVEEISAESSTVDANLDFKSPGWDQKWRPEFDVTLAYNPRSAVIPVACIEGLTWTMLEPGSGDSIIAGQGGAVAFDGTLEQGSRAVLDGSRSLFVKLGSESEKVSGGSRAAAYMLLDQAIGEARASGPPGQDALLHAGGRTVLARYLSGGRVVFEVERATDILEVLARIQGHGEEHLGPAILELGNKVATTVVPYAPLIPFAGKLIAPSAFYESFDQIHRTARALFSPVIYAEDTDAIGIASINPVASSILVDGIVAAVERRVGIRPFVTIARVDYESWAFLCRKHFVL